jgi:hypothetical protein
MLTTQSPPPLVSTSPVRIGSLGTCVMRRGTVSPPLGSAGELQRRCGSGTSTSRRFATPKAAALREHRGIPPSPPPRSHARGPAKSSLRAGAAGRRRHARRASRRRTSEPHAPRPLSSATCIPPSTICATTGRRPTGRRPVCAGGRGRGCAETAASPRARAADCRRRAAACLITY